MSQTIFGNDDEQSRVPTVLDAVSSTDRFYEVHAAEYFHRTVSADMTHLYERFLPFLPAAARILDAGCGSGRDLRFFSSRGFLPIGIDASPTLVEMARAYSGVSCFVERLENLTYQHCFEAVWACASLLHVPKSMLTTALQRLNTALVAGGIMYVSVQKGSGERFASDGRFFVDYRPEEFLSALRREGFDVKASWESEDALPDRSAIQWINVLARIGKAGT
jgi:SAM-dependent methyltransferase